MSTLALAASQQPGKTAVVMAESGVSLSYRALHEHSARLAAYLAQRFDQGEVVAILLSNRPEYFEVCFAARRAGLYYVPVSTHLTAGELAHILSDSGARILFTESRFSRLLEGLDPGLAAAMQVLDLDLDTGVDTLSYAEIIRSGAVPQLPDRAMGLDFAYSSGTTGMPKGIRHALTGDPQVEMAMRTASWVSFFNLDRDSIYLSPAPLYHAAPLRFSLRCLSQGGTVVSMIKFDAASALATIQAHRVTHSQWVPTMFVRLLNLPPEMRSAFDLSTHRMALHAAAPCPIEVKRQMLRWWGPIIWEYYTGSERAGATVISPEEWLAHPGSVGRAVQGRLHIVDESGEECGPGVDGLICFEGGPRFAYHNDLAKTAEAHTRQGWATLGDIGHLDGQGYLYLTDRRANMIISGGVNIYPQEAENILLAHPIVHDVAVIGVPHDDFGEEVKAVVELRDPALASEQTAADLMAYCRERLSHLKCPRSVDFASGLPRSETGKLLKRLIRDRYRSAQTVKPADPAGSAPPLTTDRRHAFP